MPKTFTDQTATVVGTPLNASNLNNLLTSADVGVATTGVPGLDGNSHVLQQAVYDATEASTLDTLGSASTIVNNLNRLRNQLGVVIGNAGSAWNAAVQMIPVAQKHAASGVASLNASTQVVEHSSWEGIASGLITFDAAGYPIIGGAAPAGTPTVSITNAGTGATATVDSWSTNVFGHVTSTAGTGGAIASTTIHTLTLANSANFPTNARVLVWGYWGIAVLTQNSGTPANFTTAISVAAPASNSLSFYYLIVRNA